MILVGMVESTMRPQVYSDPNAGYGGAVAPSQEYCTIEISPVEFASIIAVSSGAVMLREKFAGP
jgi:hypothetical protein